MSDPTTKAQQFGTAFERLQNSVKSRILGQDEVVDATLLGFFAGGHVLLEGVPGVGKTALVRALSQALHLDFQRIQFTPDLMPADVTGTRIFQEKEDGGRHFVFEKGPLFSHLVLADEINRATPKTQSALLEAMQEHRITVAGTTHVLEEPFMVLATQNPIEMEGTFPLPEAQLDRFMVKVQVPFPNEDTLTAILKATTGEAPPDLEPVVTQEEALAMQAMVREVAVAEPVEQFAVNLVARTHPEHAEAPTMVDSFLRYGSSPRGLQSLILMSKARALSQGRWHISFEDLEAVYLPCLRHRALLNFEGEAEGVKIERVLEEVFQNVTALSVASSS